MINLDRLINNPQIIAKTLKDLPPLQTAVLDAVYPAASRRMHPFAQIGIDEVADTVMTVPVVRRGAPGVPLDQADKGPITYIEPQPIRIEESIGAKEANDIRVLGQDWQQFLSQKLDRIRRKVRATTEALAAQSLTGTIQYPLLLENGQYTTYEVDFTRGGANPTLSYDAPVKWNDASATLDKVIWDLMEIVRLMQEHGFGSRVRFWAGRVAYSQLMSLVQAANVQKKATALTASIEGPTINVGGFTVELANWTYKNPQTGNAETIVPDDKLLAWDQDAPFTLFYLAIDHFKAGLKPIQLFVYGYQTERGDAYKIFAESKPLPCPVVKAICWATVIA